MCEGDPAAREELAGTEPPVGDTGREPVEEPVDGDEEDECAGETDHGRGGPRDDDLVPKPGPFDPLRARLDERGADQAPDQGVGRARGQAGAPRKEVPGDRTEERGQHRLLGDQASVDEPLADGRGDGGRHECAGEVRGCRDEHRPARRERPGPDPGCHVVCRVVETVREVERESYGNHENEQRQGLRAPVQRFLTTIASSTSAAYSQASIACSRLSWMSFQRITSSGSARAMKRLETLS